MLLIKPIDLDDHGSEAVANRADSFEVSFGSAGEFFSAYRKDGSLYLDHLRGRMAEQPGSCVHAWNGSTLVGQIELRDGREDPQEGYVNLYYLVPRLRGRGLGQELDAYAIRWFLDRGMTSAALGVSRTNARALRFYKKMGWVSCGEHPKGKNAILMRKELERSHAA
jgi:GNAT superfamily N-acetyltransferase